MDSGPAFIPLRTRRPHDGSSLSSADSTYGSASDGCSPATHDISRVSYHVKHLENFVSTLQDSANRAFPNRGRPSQRYFKVKALLLHWKSDDLFVLPELEDLDKTLRDEYSFDTDIFAIPSENSHLELMLKIGEIIKANESEDTLFLIYYGGHAKIDESRQSTWCATRHPSSPWLQWSAIQTLLERSASDVLILLDCCAGAASATFPNGQSITETISASSWDAIAPDPGRYSFTNALIEVLQEWRHRTFSAAMLHAEVLARLKHPRPILINGKHFEARSTPVHFMMTSNHKAPSIEIGRIMPDARRPITPPTEQLPKPLPPVPSIQEADGRRAAEAGPADSVLVPEVTDPNEDHPHVMISLALEDDQRLDLNAWEQWLANFPALAKHVKIQGVFQSHSTLLLLSLPVMVWDLLPDDPAYSFVAFIRSNNLLRQTKQAPEPIQVSESTSIAGPSAGPRGEIEEPNPEPERDGESIGGSTVVNSSILSRQSRLNQSGDQRLALYTGVNRLAPSTISGPVSVAHQSNWSHRQAPLAVDGSGMPPYSLQRQRTAPPVLPGMGGQGLGATEAISRTMIINQSRSSKRTIFASENVPEGPALAKHVVLRLEEYFQKEREPSVAVTEFLASNLGVETDDIRVWFHHRREQEKLYFNLQNLQIGDHASGTRAGARMILAGQLNNLLETFPSKSVLVIDLRSSTDYEKSHIHDAINLRTPLSFVEVATLEMIEDTFTDSHSQRNFAKWSQSRCIIFYDRMVEYTWECPIADALFDKLRSKGWPGQCFVLKGHYKEFCVSFDKYIGGTKMTQQAKDYIDGLRQQPAPSQMDATAKYKQYEEWLRTFDSEDRGSTAELVPAKQLERKQAVEQHQRELEVEFQLHFSALHKKAQALRPFPPPPNPSTAFSERAWESSQVAAPHGGNWKDTESFDLKAGLVSHLDRGLDKMREAGGFVSSYSTPPELPPKQGKEAYTDKLGERVERYSDEFDEIDPKGEGLKNDPAFQQAGAGAKHESPVEWGEDNKKKGRRPLWNRLRSSGNK